MKAKDLLLFSIFICYGYTIKSQVNLKTGGAEFSLPVCSYNDNVSGIFLNVGISYSSQNGVLVDEVPSSLGQGWNISGLGLIARIENGLPDDQLGIDGAWNNTDKYPAGYLYNSKPISDGCPNLLLKYPIFGDKNTLYKDHNITGADREQDIFIFSFNGRNGRFVIDKTTNTLIMLSDSKLIGNFEIGATNDCRTMINKFNIIDEYGIQYEFAEKELSKSYDYYPDNYSMGYNQWLVNKPHEISNSYKPYVIKNWYLTKIIDPKTNRAINFTYSITTNEMDAGFDIQYSSSSGSTTANQSGIYVRTSTVLTKIKNHFKKPEINKVDFPDGSYLEFNYGQERFDCPGTYKLNNITRYDPSQERITKTVFTQKYFVKNDIIEADATNSKWSRLCLTAIEELGKTDNDKTMPYLLDYFSGENATENFVPPVFFHAKDPWGYYNGNYCGVTVAEIMDEAKLAQIPNSPANTRTNAKILALYNSTEHNGTFPGSQNFEGYCLNYIRSNVKTDFAKYGLLKSITNPYGGRTEYSYEQNKVYQNCFNSTYHSIDPDAVGGVHVSKIEVYTTIGGTPNITEYKYVNADNTSSMWGVEYPTNIKRNFEFYEPEGKYFTASGCKYNYIYSGVTRHQGSSNSSMSTIQKIVSTVVKVQQAVAIVRGILNIIRSPNLIAMPNNVLVQYIVGLIESCEPQFETGTTYIHYNSILNFSNSLPSQFKRAEVRNYSNGIDNGKVIYEFTSDDDFPVLIPQNYFPYTNKLRAYNWAYGLPKKISILDNNNQIIKTTENSYQLIENVFTGENTKSCNCTPQYSRSQRSDEWNSTNEINSFSASTVMANWGGLNYPKLTVEFYNQKAGRVELISTTEKMYKTPTDFITNTVEYTYNPNNYLLASTKIIDAKARLIENKTYYPEDYNLGIMSVLQDMVNDNIVNVPVSTETWQTKPGQSPEMLSASATEFGIAPNGGYKPITTYDLETDQPVPQNTIGVFDPDQLIRNTGLILPKTEIKYNDNGNPVQVIDLQGMRNTTTLYSYGSTYPIAMLTNATIDEVAYTSFEAFDQGYVYNLNWDITNADILTEAAPTGNKVCSLRVTPFESVLSASISINEDYKLSLWATSTSFTVNGGLSPVLTGPTTSGWTYYEFKIPNGSLSPVIRGNNCKIDELRLYPEKATVNTITYNYGIGKTSECDRNNRITYYEYDGLGRMSKILDERHNIIKTYEYHFKN